MAGKLLTSCTFSALKAAVAAGGTVDYGANCSSPPITFTSKLSVASGLTVDIEADGHTVTFDGADTVRLFQVTGGKLTIGGITLEDAVADGTNGQAGGNGATGTTGTSGGPGANGTNATSPGANGGPGMPGVAGGKATAGGMGVAGGGGTSAQGGALYITAGTVILNNDTLSNDSATGGAGGAGG
jgi:hypothetical protein